MANDPKPLPPTGVRIPDDLRDWLRQQAAENSRSLNQEIIHRLKHSRLQQEQVAGAAAR